MQNEIYRHRVFEAVQAMNAFEPDLFDVILNVALSGELKEWSDSVPIGEAHTFHNDLLEACDDINIQIAVKVWNNLKEAIRLMCNLNGFQMITRNYDDEFTKEYDYDAEYFGGHNEENEDDNLSGDDFNDDNDDDDSDEDDNDDFRNNPFLN